jgi:hypothetical protein
MIELYVAKSDRPALVDDDFPELIGSRWELHRDGYATRKVQNERGVRTRQYLHHLILPGKRYPLFVRDHINRDRLDCR